MSGPRPDSNPCHALVVETLDALASQPDRPGCMEPFDRLFRERLRREELAGRTRKVIGQFCDFVPDELVLALGAVPLRLESGCQARVKAGERLLPPDVCCAVRAAAGDSVDEGWPLSHADLVVVPTACDGKKKLASILAATHEVHTLELPQSNRGERALAWWRGEIRRLIRRVRSLTGQRLTRRSLREAIQLVNRRVALVRRMNELRRADIPPIAGADAFLVMHATFVADPAWWNEKAGDLVRELEARHAAGRGIRPRARILLTGSPILFPDYTILRLVAESAADVVADEVCSGTQRLHHAVTVDEWTQGGMIEAAAERVLVPCACPCFTGNEGRLDRLQELTASHRVDGILHHTLRLCQPYDLDARALAEKIKERGTPWLEIHAEFGWEDAARIRNRIEAFVEVIASGKS